MNVLYNPLTQRPAFIDFEGSVIVRTEEQIQTCNPTVQGVAAEPQQSKPFYIDKRGARAINARIPELLNGEFDIFAADVWCLGDMLRNVSQACL